MARYHCSRFNEYPKCKFAEKCIDSDFFDFFQACCILDDNYSTKSWAVNAEYKLPCHYCEHMEDIEELDD